MTSNSDAMKERIAELRRKRAAAKGKAERAKATIDRLRVIATNEWSYYQHLGREIVSLGGKIR